MFRGVAEKVTIFTLTIVSRMCLTFSYSTAFCSVVVKALYYKPDGRGFDSR
jgi:hypothetical protein